MAKTTTRFADHPGIAHQQAVIRNLEKNTGRTLDQWVRLPEAMILRCINAQQPHPLVKTTLSARRARPAANPA